MLSFDRQRPNNIIEDGRVGVHVPANIQLVDACIQSATVGQWMTPAFMEDLNQSVVAWNKGIDEWPRSLLLSSLSGKSMAANISLQSLRVVSDHRLELDLPDTSSTAHGRRRSGRRNSHSTDGRLNSSRPSTEYTSSSSSLSRRLSETGSSSYVLIDRLNLTSSALFEGTVGCDFSLVGFTHGSRLTVGGYGRARRRLYIISRGIEDDFLPLFYSPRNSRLVSLGL